MTRPWFEGGIAQAVQQIINAVKGVLCPELLFEDALELFAAKRADAIAAIGASLDAGLKSGFVIAPEFGRRAATRMLLEVSQPAVAITVGPLLHKPPTAVESCGDLRRRLPVQREPDSTIPVALFCVALSPLKLLEDIQVLRATKFDVHAKPPCIYCKGV